MLYKYRLNNNNTFTSHITKIELFKLKTIMQMKLCPFPMIITMNCAVVRRFHINVWMKEWKRSTNQRNESSSHRLTECVTMNCNRKLRIIMENCPATGYLWCAHYICWPKIRLNQNLIRFWLWLNEKISINWSYLCGLWF